MLLLYSGSITRCKVVPMIFILVVVDSLEMVGSGIVEVSFIEVVDVDD